ncbi:MAG: 2-oxo acid dehydrogenase subunit E2 [Calditrichaeota bacterium]|nr:2-oxo acid dehydrogenase subunit E2 [Calditrichota bacterium]MBT7617945.1 2-oxo acid dehydrogenase subunit E2 [Calditrichota bacterium]MBT7787547.1 2-oxo acid dehydrogenase subunit E2 [Calditrichota bacterium]
MKVEMVMPQMGESIAEGTIVKWIKSVGDRVELDEDILEISTDKVDSEIPTPATGVIAEILIQEGTTVPIGTVLALIETEGDVSVEKKEKLDEYVKGEEPANRPSAQDSSPHDGSDHGGLKVRVFSKVGRKEETPVAEIPAEKKSTFISPLVQNIAATEGIPLDVVQNMMGSGRDGRVTKKDMLNYIADKKTRPIPTPAMVTPKAAVVPPAAPIITKLPAPAAAPTAAPSVWTGPEDEIVEMDRMRKMIADHMVRSVHTSPHVVSFSEVDMDRIVKHRESIKKSFKEREGFSLTYTSYFIKVAAEVLPEFPFVNASVDGYNMILRKKINIGFAVELPGAGLIVPNIKGADGLNLKGIAHGLHDLAEKARSSSLLPDDVSGGTFTITNVGVFGNIAGAPIINQPQVAILGTGAIRKVPAVVETEFGDSIAIRWRMMMSLSYDHRIIDGAMAGRFMARLKEKLEKYEE